MTTPSSYRDFSQIASSAALLTRATTSQIGCSAYADCRGRASRPGAKRGTGARLYRELEDRFGEFVEILAEVGDRTRPGRPQNLLGVYDRYLRTGSARDRDLLLRAGYLPPDRSGLRWWQ